MVSDSLLITSIVINSIVINNIRFFSRKILQLEHPTFFYLDDYIEKCGYKNVKNTNCSSDCTHPASSGTCTGW